MNALLVFVGRNIVVRVTTGRREHDAVQNKCDLVTSCLKVTWLEKVSGANLENIKPWGATV